MAKIVNPEVLDPRPPASGIEAVLHRFDATAIQVCEHPGRIWTMLRPESGPGQNARASLSVQRDAAELSALLISPF
jgi:hypothetical protein